MNEIKRQFYQFRRSIMTFSLIFFLLYFSWAFSLPLEEASLSFKLIHINDIHAHFEEVNENVGRCHREQAEANQCFGGAPRIKTAVDQIRNEKPDLPSVFLNAGDYYQVISDDVCLLRPD